jgi:hypothetical protein
VLSDLSIVEKLSTSFLFFFSLILCFIHGSLIFAGGSLIFFFSSSLVVLFWFLIGGLLCKCYGFCEFDL